MTAGHLPLTAAAAAYKRCTIIGYKQWLKVAYTPRQSFGYGWHMLEHSLQFTVRRACLPGPRPYLLYITLRRTVLTDQPLQLDSALKPLCKRHRAFLRIPSRHSSNHVWATRTGQARPQTYPLRPSILVHKRPHADPPCKLLQSLLLLWDIC